jgi:hypothetical protein
MKKAAKYGGGMARFSADSVAAFGCGIWVGDELGLDFGTRGGKGKWGFTR